MPLPHCRTKLMHWMKAPIHWLAHLFQSGLDVQEETPYLYDQQPLTMNKQGLAMIRKRYKSMDLSSNTASASPASLSPIEQRIMNQIRRDTGTANANNITRTQAYYNIYKQSPEIHWALLAHMVSRNGGYNMTDLKGEWLPRLLSKRDIRHVFDFLERANALIFQDAYPQLRLYQESLKLGQSLFHLLPYFHVSKFMSPCWEQFWKTKDPVLLTIALIINEQHYIEGRVVQHPEFKQQVIHTLFFQAQSMLQLNQVIFPFKQEQTIELTGAILAHFSNIRERIEIGKLLYTLLFALPTLGQKVEAFAAHHPHTGSRADYWPELFSRVNHVVPNAPYKERLDGCKLKDGAAPLYSPELTFAWPNQAFTAPKTYDWFKSLDVLDYFEPAPIPKHYILTDDYCSGLNTIEWAVAAGESIGLT